MAKNRDYGAELPASFGTTSKTLISFYQNTLNRLQLETPLGQK